jgi:hypothetical protein
MSPRDSLIFEKLLQDLMRRFNADEADVVEALFENKKMPAFMVPTLTKMVLEEHPVEFYEHVFGDMKEASHYSGAAIHYHLIHLVDELEGELVHVPSAKGMAKRFRETYNPADIEEILEVMKEEGDE